MIFQEPKTDLVDFPSRPSFDIGQETVIACRYEIQNQDKNWLFLNLQVDNTCPV